MNKIITFGEIMARLAPHGNLRFLQSMPGSLEVTFAGSEANVAASLCMLGAEAAFVSAIPDNPIGQACINVLRGLGVDTSYLLKSDVGRMGLYFLETGANQRPSNVIYDRDSSSVSLTGADEYPWTEILDGADWFHVSGITPAISRMAAEAALAAVEAAKQAGVTVSCDLNFRKKLWRWDPDIAPRELAEKTMRGILPRVDVVIANEEDCVEVLGIRAGQTDIEAGKLQCERYPDVARQVVKQFPNVDKVAITLRESISATHNNWGAMLYCAETDNACFAPMQQGAYTPYQIRSIVDRVGGGDSFAAGLIYALHTDDSKELRTALEFAVAASCLAHSIKGDFNYSTRPEVEKLMTGSGSGRVSR
jgi:2-dehydro-3-deoxygluconokinase